MYIAMVWIVLSWHINRKNKVYGMIYLKNISRLDMWCFVENHLKELYAWRKWLPGGKIILFCKILSHLGSSVFMSSEWTPNVNFWKIINKQNNMNQWEVLFLGMKVQIVPYADCYVKVSLWFVVSVCIM